MGIANSIVFFSAETSLGIGVLHTSTGYNIRITVTVHIHHCHLILRTAACIVKGNSQSSALVHLALALGNQRNGCRTGSLQAITCQTGHIHLIIQRIGNDHILFCQSGRTGFSSCQVDFLTLSDPAVGRHLVCAYRCERQGQRVNLGILILREFEQSLVNGLAIASLGSIVNEAAPATVQHTETAVDTFRIESGIHAVLRQTKRIGLQQHTCNGKGILRQRTGIMILEPDLFGAGIFQFQHICLQSTFCYGESLFRQQLVRCLYRQGHVTVESFCHCNTGLDNYRRIRCSERIGMTFLHGMGKHPVMCRNRKRLVNGG